MTERELLLAFQCYSPSAREDRHCESCPLSNNFSDCHRKLCEATIQYIITQQGKLERVKQDSNKLVNEAISLRNMIIDAHVSAPQVTLNA